MKNFLIVFPVFFISFSSFGDILSFEVKGEAAKKIFQALRDDTIKPGKRISGGHEFLKKAGALECSEKIYPAAFGVPVEDLFQCRFKVTVKD